MASSPLQKETIDIHIELTLQWLSKSISATNGKGSAGYYHIWKGWSEGYPETTGYLIESLFDAYHLTKLEALKLTAINCANWLCTLQLPSGAFPGGVGGKLPPLIFDTGMVLFGLRRAWEETLDSRYLDALNRAMIWLETQMDKDGVWRNHAYVQGFVPSYYTMVVWAMLKANNHLNIGGLNEMLTLTLDNISGKMTTDVAIQDWGFRPIESAFTHTIAYTLQGMLEAGWLLKKKDDVVQVRNIAEKILTIRQEKGKLAGSYDVQWRGDYSFGCLTGQAQLSVLYFRLFQLFKEDEFLNEAQFLLWQMMRFQCTTKIEGWLGGIPGSAPIWGKYQRFRFPNWGAKFFLDALLESRQYAQI